MLLQIASPNLLRAAALAGLVTLGGIGLGGPAFARAAPESFADLAAKLSPAVVNISTTQKVQGAAGGRFDFQFPPGSPLEEFFKDFLERNRPGQQPPSQGQRPQPRRQITSLGSGFIVDGKGGLVVTNNHVISEADEITVTTQDGQKFEAKLAGRDAKTDLALLRIKVDKELPAVKFGSSDGLRVGDWVLAIGNPFGLGGTVTAGIVSARGRDINSGPYDDFIQTDAAINRGNSGGPLFNMAGEVIGVNTAIYSPTGSSVGIGFAIPSSIAKSVVEQLNAFGRTKRGWLGVRIQTVTDEIAEGLSLQPARGALVAGISEKGPAEVAGLEQGDVILRFDGKEVGEMRALPRAVAETPIGKTVEVEVWRKGKLLKKQVKVGELEESEQEVAAADPKQATPGKEVQSLGMKLARITPELRERFELKDDAKGVVVTEVTADSAAAERGVRPGDVIVEVAQEEVAQPQDVVDKVKKVQEAKRKTVLMLIQRASDLRFVPLKLEQG
ncbi:MAG: DegQ family serine endoprotease [Alphaproteobacteria bacterium]|nr:DegQ family serine endoprotease [Alphaproteobacteria bacterium]